MRNSMEEAKGVHRHLPYLIKVAQKTGERPGAAGYMAMVE